MDAMGLVYYSAYSCATRRAKQKFGTTPDFAVWLFRNVLSFFSFFNPVVMNKDYNRLHFENGTNNNKLIHLKNQ
jgi:hypothetical protein